MRKQSVYRLRGELKRSIGSWPALSRFDLLSALLVCVSLMSVMEVAVAQNSEEDELLSKPRGLYLGVRPGEQNFAPGKQLEAIQGLQRIVWVGFQNRRDRARVFVQTDAPPLF